jgi:hypothetical protein
MEDYQNIQIMLIETIAYGGIVLGMPGLLVSLCGMVKRYARCYGSLTLRKLERAARGLVWLLPSKPNAKHFGMGNARQESCQLTEN